MSGARGLRGPAAAALAWLAACQGLDTSVLDERLRAATVESYVAVIDAQFGGLEAAGVSADGLRDRYAHEARAAASPGEFYRVLKELLCELDDPHASLAVSARFWEGPVAEPEGTQCMRHGNDLWLALPEASVRTRAELQGELSGWLEGIEGEVERGAPRASARLLVRSAAAARFGGERTRWLRLSAVDGVAVERPHAAEMLLEGRLGSIVEVEVELDGAPTRLALMRNAGSFAPERTGAPREVLGPEDLAQLLDPTVRVARPPWWRGSSRSRSGGPSRAPSRERVRRALRAVLESGETLPVPEALSRTFGLEARILRTPSGGRAAYLRLTSFHPGSGGPTPGGVEVEEGAPGQGLSDGLTALLPDLEPGGDLILDLCGNPGGSWAAAGALLSHFLPDATRWIPHEVRSVEETWTLGLRSRKPRLLRQAPLQVERVRPRRILVLVDQRTASAGEIVASALRGLCDARLVGERTAGAEFSTGRYRAPDGSVLTVGLGGGMLPPCEHFQCRGLTPDIEVDRPAPARTALDPGAWRESLRLEALLLALDALDEGGPAFGSDP